MPVKRSAKHFALLAATALLLSIAKSALAEDSDAVARGRYLVVEVARCGECHTPKTSKGEPDMAHWLEGGPLLSPLFACVKLPPGVIAVSPSIAGLPADWTKEQLARFLETGATPSGVPARPFMPQYRLDPEDATAIASYLKVLRPHRPQHRGQISN